MQAHQIVKFFGIDALSNFATEDNAAEIAQCRQDWQDANATTLELCSFNDGSNAFEVVLYFDTMEAHRTDCGTDVTDEYISQVVAAIVRRVQLREMFGLI